MDAYDLARYDAWRTAPPDAVFYPTYCPGCDETFDSQDETSEGEECPECGDASLIEVDPDVPCICTGAACYC
jgi:hypothetical protein